MMSPATTPDDEDEVASPSAGRRAFRLGLVAMYVTFCIALIAFNQIYPSQGSLQILTYLFAVYMAARALAQWLTYRRETRPPRYSKSYIRADDLFPPQNKSDTDEKPNGSPHG
ncbi:MAG: hypothetical protein AB2A00_08125 [Myxococcota bacterium]